MILFLVALLLLISVINNAHAEPLAEIRGEEVTLTLYSERCTVHGAMQGLTRRAAWREVDEGKVRVYEGCYDVRKGEFIHGIEDVKFVVIYFTDNTIVVEPVAAFDRPRPPI